MTTSPIEDYLDELLRRTHADPRTTRRLVDEANDHLQSLAAELETGGLARADAEREAVRRLGPVATITRGSWRHSFGALVVETGLGAVRLGAYGLVAVGLSGILVAGLNAAFGDDFVGGATVLGTGGSSVTESAQDAVSLRILAGIVGALVLAGYALARRHAPRTAVLPAGLIDALGAAAFAAAAAVLIGASVDQAVIGSHAHGVGFFLSGALMSLAGLALFGTRATRALLPHR